MGILLLLLNILMVLFSSLFLKPDCSSEDINALLGKAALFLSEESQEKKALPNVIDDLKRSMVTVEGGTFMMGCTKEQESDCFKLERPAHKVYVSTFQIAKYEVTQAQWEAIIGSNPSHFSNCGECPVESINWINAQAFIERLNKLTGMKFRLPTEAEWEYAARGGRISKGFKYAGSNNPDLVAWHSGNSNERTHPVGQKNPNELGLYDMSGNVFEWCQDRIVGYTEEPQRNPIRSARSSSGWVTRGGAWSHMAVNRSRISCRSSNGHDIESYQGLRLVI